MMITPRPARLAVSLLTAAAIVLGAGVSGAAAAPNGPGRSGDAHAEHGHPNPEAVRGHDEEGKQGKGHESHGNGHGYGHGDHHGGEEIVIIDEPAADQPIVNEPSVGQPNVSDSDARIVPVGEVSVVVNAPTSPVTNQSKTVDPVVETDESASLAIAPVEVRSNEGFPMEYSVAASANERKGVEMAATILRFR